MAMNMFKLQLLNHRTNDKSNVENINLTQTVTLKAVQ